MDLLIIGGTVFVGRALVEAALERGHRLTLFNRGKSGQGLYPQIEQIHGDREKDLDLLKNRTWDAVIDTCGYVPRIVQLSAQRLANQVGMYAFISTASVYASLDRQGIDEKGALGKLADESIEEVTGESYGPLKALCEQAVERELPGRSLLIRPGLIVGPHDASDRFTYWPWRVAQGGSILAPGRPDRRLQFMDVRDLAGWTIRAIEAGLVGVFNANGPAGMCSMSELLETCQDESNSDAVFRWAGDDFLLREQVGPWMEMPLWIPENDADSVGFYSINTQKAVRAGLTIRSLHETVRSVLDWLPERGERPWKAGLDPERERVLLEKLSLV
jgi:2'-hydroxyisoflavone reductase